MPEPPTVLRALTDAPLSTPDAPRRRLGARIAVRFVQAWVGVVVTIAVVLAAVHLGSSGPPATDAPTSLPPVELSARLLFSVYQARGVTTLVPNGWIHTSTGGGTVTFANPADARANLSISTTRPTLVPALNRARILAEEAGALSVPTVRQLLLPERRAYRIAYSLGGIAHAIYVFTSCHKPLAVTVVISAPGSVKDLLRSPYVQIPGFVEPSC